MSDMQDKPTHTTPAVQAIQIRVWSVEEVLEKSALKTSDDRNKVSEACLQSLNKPIPTPSPSGDCTIELTWTGCELGKSWRDVFHIVASSEYDILLSWEASEKLLEAQRQKQGLLALAEKTKRDQEEEGRLARRREAIRQRQLEERKEQKRKILEDMLRKAAAAVV